ncbi:hypothetical protein JB92DRAFT_2720060 [Gautieria morchelliformis]|nr:hypothetical protein JB92DRAFT_2720060 [Gautieria morchelliformis]
MINVDFSTDMSRIQYWGSRMGVDLRDGKQLTEPYAWSQNRLLSLTNLLIDFHGFRLADISDNRMLFALVCDPHAWRVGSIPGLVPPRSRIELPVHASSFFSPQRRKQWENIFHDPLWDCIGNTNVPGSNAVMDLLNLLQCLLPGMFIVTEVHDSWWTQRGIPPYLWVLESKDVLVSCLGLARYEELCRAASDTRRAVIDSRDASMGW